MFTGVRTWTYDHTKRMQKYFLTSKMFKIIRRDKMLNRVYFLTFPAYFDVFLHLVIKNISLSYLLDRLFIVALKKFNDFKLSLLRGSKKKIERYLGGKSKKDK